MLKIFTLLFSLHSSPAVALSYQAQCVGNHGRVSILIRTEGDRLSLRYLNSMGASDFPFYEGLVTKLALPFLKEAERELSAIDTEAVASWPISACKFSEKRPLLVSCNGPSDFQVPANAKIGSTMFSTTISREESLDYAYDVFRLRWGMDGENFHHFIVMPFDPANCEARYKP